MITGIKDVFYPVAEMDRSVAFYRRLLGQEASFASDYWSEFRVGGTAFGLHWTEGRPIVVSEPGGAWAGGTVTFHVADIDAAAAQLAAWGIAVVGPIDRQPWGNQLAIRDPDGNILKLMATSAENAPPDER